MKCQILFSGKTLKNITNLLSAEIAKSVVKVKCFLPPSNSLEDMTSNDIHGVISLTTFGSLPWEPPWKGNL